LPGRIFSSQIFEEARTYPSETGKSLCPRLATVAPKKTQPLSRGAAIFADAMAKQPTEIGRSKSTIMTDLEK
jgi:hypothetical protein